LIQKIEKLRQNFQNTDLYVLWKKIFGTKLNTNSSVQLQKVLYDKMGLTPLKTTPTGAGSCDEESLEHLDNPALRKLLQIRKYSKLINTYLKNLRKETVKEGEFSYMHPGFNLHTVSTYRSSSNNPNFQNQPKHDKESMRICRKSIKARPGHQLMAMDFSKLEVGIAACYHKDPVMLEYLKSDHNDMHGDLAQQIFFISDTEWDKNVPEYALLRNAAKSGFIFPQFYGDYYKNNAEGLRKWVKLGTGRWKPNQGVQLSDGKHISDHMIENGITSSAKFVQHLQGIESDFWNNRFRVYEKWKRRWLRQYQKQGYIRMYTGFRCKGVMRQNSIINYPIQGTAFHCLLWSLIQIEKEIKDWDSRIVGQIHDEIVFDVLPKEQKELEKLVIEITTKRLPAEWKWINIPLQVDTDLFEIDGSWAEKIDLP